MKNQRKTLLYLLLSMGICSGILLTDRFIICVPNWIAIGLIVIALVSLFIGCFNLFRGRGKKE